MRSDQDPAVAAPAPSYWRQTAPPLAAEPGRLEADSDCDVVVVGAGYTGVSTALHLARDYAARVCVLEAAEPGWGASGRNGGWACMGASRHSWQALIRRHGLAETRLFHTIQREAVALVRRLCGESGMDAEATADGLITLAHSRSQMAALGKEAAFMRENFGEDWMLLDTSDLATGGWAGPTFHGAALEPCGFGLHPLRYLRGLVAAATAAGVRVYGHSPVTRWQRSGDRHVLTTPAGSVTADHVVFATNGYTPEHTASPLAGRLLPVVSTILVTRPLSEAERAAQGWTRFTPAGDTRTLLHYFRLLPDGRFLFGGRGTAKGTARGEAQARSLLRSDFERMFPAWRAVATTHTWQGNICTTRSGTPSLGPLDAKQTVWTALGYHGNGVAMSTWSGRTLAGLISGDPAIGMLPGFLRRPPVRFPLPALRRRYLQAAYLVYGLRDRLG